MSEYFVVEMTKDCNFISNDNIYYNRTRLLVRNSDVFDSYTPVNTSDYVPREMAKKINKLKLVEEEE